MCFIYFKYNFFLYWYKDLPLTHILGILKIIDSLNWLFQALDFMEYITKKSIMCHTMYFILYLLLFKGAQKDWCLRFWNIKKNEIIIVPFQFQHFKYWVVKILSSLVMYFFKCNICKNHLYFNKSYYFAHPCISGYY